MRAGLLDVECCAHPGFPGRAVERRHDRHRDGGLRQPNQLEITVDAQCVLIEGGEVGERRGKARIGRVSMTDFATAAEGDLFLEQRVQDDGRGAGIFESLDGVQCAGERGSADHIGMGEPKAEVGR